jgi:aspartate carbamoyltransferase catalytic subunit
MDSTDISPYSHILESQQFDIPFIEEVLRNTKLMKERRERVSHELSDKVVAMLFYEPSTRTRFSFESAAKRLGAQTISTENAKEFSSAAKGETLQDSIRMVSGYADFIIIRHYDNDSSEIAASVSDVPVINAGSGTGQHPTQALLDIYTIHENFGRLSNLKICLVGDLLHGRTVNSLVYLLAKFKGNEFYFVAPESFKVKDGIKEHLLETGHRFEESEDLSHALKICDVVYMTRVQKERFDDMKEFDKIKGRFVIDRTNIGLMKPSALLLHPLPRVDEINPEVDNDARSKYFDQARNGLYVRMALLKMLNDHNYGEKPSIFR